MKTSLWLFWMKVEQLKRLHSRVPLPTQRSWSQELIFWEEVVIFISNEPICCSFRSGPYIKKLVLLTHWSWVSTRVPCYECKLSKYLIRRLSLFWTRYYIRRTTSDPDPDLLIDCCSGFIMWRANSQVPIFSSTLAAMTLPVDELLCSVRLPFISCSSGANRLKGNVQTTTWLLYAGNYRLDGRDIVEIYLIEYCENLIYFLTIGYTVIRDLCHDLLLEDPLNQLLPWRTPFDDSFGE